MIGVQIKGRQHVSVWDLTSWRTSKIPRAMWVWPTLSCKSSLPPHVNPRKIPSRFWRLMASLLLCSSAGPAQSGILTDREVVSLFLHFTVNPKPRVEFIDRPRCCLRGKECSISRFQQVESRWGYSGTSDRIRSASLLILLLIDSCLLSFEPTLDLNPQGYMLDPGLHHINPSVNPEGKVFCWAKASPDALTCMCSCRLPLCFCIGKGFQQMWPSSTGLLGDYFSHFQVASCSCMGM